MKDLDFDELDRAVNSLITTSGSGSNAGVEPTAEIPQDSPETVEQTPAEPSNIESTPPLTPVVTRPTTGRFMDVVPPSSNTRVNPTMPENVSRQGVTVAPVVDSPIMPEEAPAEPAALSEPTPQPTTDWPDPIDYQGSKTDTEPKVEITPEDDSDADIDQINDDITNTMNQTAAGSPDSPFVAGAIVEKRPLGAFSSEEPAVEEAAPIETPAESTAVETPDAPITTEEPVKEIFDLTPTDTITPVPAELHADLLSIESGGETQPDSPTDTETTAAANVPAPEADSQPPVPTSITQQYKEQPSTGDQTSGAIYDTDAYHKALLNKPTKKKSGWLWVLWIVILLVVGAGAGAAVFFLVLPKL